MVWWILSPGVFQDIIVSDNTSRSYSYVSVVMVGAFLSLALNCYCVSVVEVGALISYSELLLCFGGRVP